MLHINAYRLNILFTLYCLTCSKCRMIEAHCLHITSFIHEAMLLDKYFRNFHYPKIRLLHMSFKIDRFSWTNQRCCCCSSKCWRQRNYHKERFRINISTAINICSHKIYVVSTRLNISIKDICSQATSFVTTSCINPAPSPCKVFI